MDDDLLEGTEEVQVSLATEDESVVLDPATASITVIDGSGEFLQNLVIAFYHC